MYKPCSANKMKRLLLVLTILLPGLLDAATAVRDTLIIDELSNEYLDTVKVYKRRLINDYSMIGVNYGVAFCNMSFNPSRHNRAYQICPNHMSVMYSHYEKLFDRYANFCFHIGFEYSHEGAGFKIDPDTGQYYNNIDGANRLTMEIMDIPVLAGFHVDAAPVKFQGAVGAYGGYRKSIERSGEYMDETYAHKFRDYEYRLDYGLQGSAGVALMFDPIEIHFNCLVRWGWQSLYEPNYYSEYYYRYAYPLDIIVTAGIHFQLSKRTGKTSKDLKRQAKDIVYGTTEDSDR